MGPCRLPACRPSPAGTGGERAASMDLFGPLPRHPDMALTRGQPRCSRPSSIIVPLTPEVATHKRVILPPGPPCRMGANMGDAAWWPGSGTHATQKLAQPTFYQSVSDILRRVYLEVGVTVRRRKVCRLFGSDGPPNPLSPRTPGGAEGTSSTGRTSAPLLLPGGASIEAGLSQCQ